VRVDELLAQLRDDLPAEQVDAIEQVRGLARRRALTEEEGLALLRAAPSIEPQAALVAALAEDPRMPYLPVIEDLAGALAPEARTRAIAMVGMIDDPTAARTFLRLVAAFPDDSPSLAFAHLKEHPQQADVLFPALLPLTRHPALTADVLATAVAYCGEGRMRPHLLAQEADRLLALYRAGPEPEQAALLLDLMGCMPLELVEADLRRALESDDPVLLYYACNSLLTHGVVPPSEVLARIAASDQTRDWLRALLDDAGRPELFPVPPEP
jgi:hypothetical protein